MRCGARVGDGQAAKLVNNAINAATRLGTLEITALGRKAGYSLADLTATLNAGAARNQTTDKMLPALARGEASTNFALSLMLKDLNQAVDLGMSQGVAMPLSGLTRSLLQFGLNKVGEHARLEDMVSVMESIVGARIATDSGTAASAEPHALPALEKSVAALCRSVTLECVMAGLKYGLKLEVLNAVLSQSSGGTAAGATLLPALVSGITEAAQPLSPWVDAHRKTMQLSIRLGAPLLLTTAVHNLYECAAAEFGAQADLAHLVELSTRSAGVRL
ncbi:tartronate semialdehyde reductase [compost metagenome]